MEVSRSAKVLRLLGEAVVIGAGVLAALFADDWRENRSERLAALAGLEIVAVDLRADSAEFERFRQQAQRLATTSAWLLSVWDDPSPPQDSLEVALYQYSTGSPFQVNRAGFEGLRDTNRLHLIQDDSIRAGVLRYYQERHGDLEGRRGLFDPRRDRLVYEVLPNHVIDLEGGDPGTVWPPKEDRVRLRHPWSVATEDPYLRTDIVWLGRFMDNFTGHLERAEQVASALAAAIDREIGR